MKAEEVEQILGCASATSQISDEVIARAIRDSDSQTGEPLSPSEVYSSAFIRLGNDIAPGGVAGLSVCEFRDTILEFMTTVGKSDKFAEKVQQLLDKRNSGHLSQIEQEEFEAISQLNESLSAAISVLRLKLKD